mgnify:CR=1 FL=1
MTEFGNIIYKCLRELNCDFSEFLNSKHERIKLQKYSYIIEKVFGLGIGRYSLYLNGPYNSVLADELYNIAHNESPYRDLMEEAPLTDETREVLENIRNLFHVDNIDEVDLLELYTTYNYLKKYYPSYDNNEIFEKLKKEKSYLFDKYKQISLRSILDSIDENIDNLIPD